MVSAVSSGSAGRWKRLGSPDAGALLFLLGSWVLAVFVVNPLGEFPVVDDWAYLTSVRPLVERGELTFSDFAAQNLIAHVLWGSLFSLPFGVSYTALRFSTLVAALLGAFALYRLVRNVGQSVAIALLAALILLFNPISFALSFSFMTDVPFVAAQTGAMLFLLVGLNTGSRGGYAAGWFLAVVAQLSRQSAVAIPIAYAGAYLTRHGFTVRRVAIAVLPILAFVVLQWAYEYWLAASGKMSLAYGQTTRTALPRLSKPSVLTDKLWDVACYVFLYMGLFLLPIAVPLLASVARVLSGQKAKLLALGIIVISAALAFYSLSIRLIMPIWPHIWRKTGIGGDNRDVAAPEIVLQVVTIFSVFGGVCLVALMVWGAYRLWLNRKTRGVDASSFVFGIISAVVLAGAISLVHPVFDRYLLPLIPCLVLAMVCSVPSPPPIPRWSVALGGVLIAVMAAYSVASGHNHNAEKRTYLLAIGNLLAQGIPRDTIDAGWVWNGESAFGRYGRKITPGRDWYKSRDYVVTVRRYEPNYVLIHSYPVPRWQIWDKPGGGVHVYKRQVPAPIGPSQ